MVANLVKNWNEANDEMRRALANSIFEYLVYDLDLRQIVDFKLKPWTELLMQLKVTLDVGDDSAAESDAKQRVLWCSRRAIKPHHVTHWVLLWQLSFGSCMPRNRNQINQRAA
jgi:hypothetical protein